MDASPLVLDCPLCGKHAVVTFPHDNIERDLRCQCGHVWRVSYRPDLATEPAEEEQAPAA